MKTALRILIVTLLFAGFQAQGTPVFKNATTAVGESSTITVDTPSGTEAGDVLVAALMLEGGKSIDVDMPTGWIKIRRANKHTFIGIATYYRIAGESEPASYSFPLDEPTEWAASISRISGVDLDDPVEASGKKNGRRGSVIAPSITPREDDTLILAFYTNRRNATYTPHTATSEHYDAPNNSEGLPSNMLATFKQATAGATGDKSATPTRSDRRWIALQIAINGSETVPPDLSGFSVSSTGSPVAGEAVTLQIANAQGADGIPLDGAVSVAIASNLDGLIVDREVAFTDGTAAISITLTTAGSHFLTAGIIGMKDAENLTLLINRRPITLSADADQSKTQNDPDPALTYALTSGTLIAGISLNGTPTRDPGEEAGLYPIRQGSLTDANNPNYAITFVSANFEIPFVDLSGFSVTTMENSVAGDSFALSITDAKDASGTPLNGSIATAVASSLDVLVFDKEIVFTDGNASLSITLTTAASHLLTVGIAGMNDAQNLTVAVSRRPLTLTADTGQSKMQDDPDPALTFTLTAGTLLAEVPLSGTLSRDSGEGVGFYSIQQGSLTDLNNPNYAITFVSADFEITAAPPPPPPPPATGIWSSAAELAELPMKGNPWLVLKADADTYWGVPNLSDQADKANIYTMSKALVYARTGDELYRTEVIEDCMQIIGSEDGGRTLALARNLAAFVIAADLVGLPPEEDAAFSAWLEIVRFENLSDGSLVSEHESEADNPGTHAGASRAAVAAYLNDQEELDRAAQVFKGWLGDRNSHAGFSYGTPTTWQSDPNQPVGINPAGATIQGYNVDGVLPDEQRKAGGFSWPPPKRNSVYESLQGALLQAVILHRAGYDVWNWEDRALLRAYKWLHETADYPAEGDDLWQPFIINYYYTTNFPTPLVSKSGKNVARTCWTHSSIYVPPVTTNLPPASPDLEYYPGDYSAEMVLGNSLPGTWRPFSDDSPWNTPIPDNAATHPNSDAFIELAITRDDNIRFVNTFLTPIWVVNTANALPVGTAPDPTQPMNLHWELLNSPSIFDTWDSNNDETSDVPMPLAKDMYSEPSNGELPGDGHICIIDPFEKKAYEMSRYYGWENDPPACTTFNIWDLNGTGVGDPFEGKKWWTRGGKASGFPLIAGILRPEEVLSGEIRHALTFSFGLVRRGNEDDAIMMWPPACRSDGKNIGEQYPMMGMRFQLDPNLTESDFDAWGLTKEGKILARALQEYGMFLGDTGGSMALAVQLLGPDKDSSRAKWEELVPGFYNTVKNIPTDQFRVVDPGRPPTLR